MCMLKEMDSSCCNTKDTEICFMLRNNGFRTGSNWKGSSVVQVSLNRNCDQPSVTFLGTSPSIVFQKLPKSCSQRSYVTESWPLYWSWGSICALTYPNSIVSISLFLPLYSSTAPYCRQRPQESGVDHGALWCWSISAPHWHAFFLI